MLANIDRHVSRYLDALWNGYLPYFERVAGRVRTRLGRNDWEALVLKNLEALGRSQKPKK